MSTTLLTTEQQAPQNRLLVINTKAPYAGQSGQESLDFVMAMANFGIETSVVFVNDGVFQLLTDQNAKNIQRKHYVKGFKSLTFYDVDNIFVCKTSLESREINQEQLNVDHQLIQENELSKIIATHQHVVTF